MAENVSKQVIHDQTITRSITNHCSYHSPVAVLVVGVALDVVDILVGAALDVVVSRKSLRKELRKSLKI